MTSHASIHAIAAAAAVDIDLVIDVATPDLADHLGGAVILSTHVGAALVVDLETVTHPVLPDAIENLSRTVVGQAAGIASSENLIVGQGDLFVLSNDGAMRGVRVSFIAENDDEPPFDIVALQPVGDAATPPDDLVIVPTRRIAAVPVMTVEDPGDAHADERLRLMAEHLSRNSMREFALAAASCVDALVASDGRPATHRIAVRYHVDPEVMARTSRAMPSLHQDDSPLHAFQVVVTLDLEADGANQWSLTFPAEIRCQFADGVIEIVSITAKQ